MVAAPIYSSIRFVRVAVVSALSALSGTAVVYWLEKADSVPGEIYPFVIVQSQDLGGQADPWIGDLGWRGLITVKALADANGTGNAQADAEALMEQIAPGMESLTAPAGHSLRAAYQRPIVVPPLDGVWQAGHTWRVRLERV